MSPRFLRNRQKQRPAAATDRAQGTDQNTTAEILPTEKQTGNIVDHERRARLVCLMVYGAVFCGLLWVHLYVVRGGQ
jgi:hypothetical protein